MMKYLINKSLLLESAFSDHIADQLSNEQHQAIQPEQYERPDTNTLHHQDANRLRHELPVPREIDRAHQAAYQGVPNIGQNFLNKFNTIASKFR